MARKSTEEEVDLHTARALTPTSRVVLAVSAEVAEAERRVNQLTEQRAGLAERYDEAVGQLQRHRRLHESVEALEREEP